MKKLFFLLCFLWSYSLAFAGTYYLSPTGSDLNNCTNSTTDACSTPNRAQRSVLGMDAGSTVIFSNGTYNYSAGVVLGAGDGGVTYQAETAGGVILNFGGVQYAWRTNGTTGGVTLDGLTFTNFKWGFVNYDDDIIVQNCNFTATTTWPPSGNAITGADGGGCIVQFTGDNLVVDNVIADQCTDPTTTSNHGIYIDSGINGTIKNSTFRNSRGNGMNFQAKGLAYGDFTGWNIYNNRVYSNTQKHGVYFRGYNASGGCASFNNINFYNNLVYDNSITGYGVVIVAENGCEANINIYNNTLHSNTYGIINASGSGNIKNNVIYSDSTDITAATISNVNLSRATNITKLGNEGNGVSGVISIEDFSSTDSANSNFLKLNVSAVTAIDTGTTLATVTDDYFGTSRPQGSGYDIGAHELSVADTTAPITTASPAAGTYVNAQSVTLTCSDAIGCASTKYCTTASCTPDISYTIPIIINETTTLRYRSTDAAANTEAIKEGVYTITGSISAGEIQVGGKRMSVGGAVVVVQ